MKTTKTKTLTRTCIALAAGTLVLAACSDDSGSPVQSDPTTDAPATATTEASTDPADNTDDAGESSGDAEGESTPAGEGEHAGVLAAIQLAESETGGTAFEIDDTDGGDWEVHVASGDEELEVRISADGTQVIATEREGSLDASDRDGLAAATITISDAIRTAAEHGTGSLDDVDLDRQGGGFVWEVAFHDDTEVYIDVVSGEVLRVD